MARRRKRPKVIGVRMSAAEYDGIRECAERQGMSLSTYLRVSALAAVARDEAAHLARFDRARAGDG